MLLDGLTGGVTYRFTLWSFDSVNSGRVADWSANGSLVRNDYLFNGSQLPTNNSQYQFSFTCTAPPEGRILIAGRRDASSSGAGLPRMAMATIRREALP